MKVMVVGWGPVGRMVGQEIAGRTNLEMAAVVDCDPALAGQTLGEAGQMAADPELRIAGNLQETIDRVKGDVAIVTTTSSLESIWPQIEALVGAGWSVVSSCEELSFPWRSAPAIAERIDRAAQEAGVVVVGTGVNPGFLMDLLPVVLSGLCRRVHRVRVERIQDAARRRIPFQKKIGAGLTLDEFVRRQPADGLGHVGLTESLHHLAQGLGWRLDRTEEEVEPVMAERELHAEGGTVPAGRVAGLEQIGRGFAGGEEKITLVFRAVIGEPAPADTIMLEGEPPLRFVVPGGTPGDAATVAVLLNTALAIGDASPGLRSMTQLPAIGCRQAPV
jgi:4-hydroxy-tetrahydrodipicolinate reductase